jgi:hypothetical protein
MGGPGYTLPDEFHPSLRNVPGALAMANAGPHTSGCQFYINLITNAHLNDHYTVFGMVTTNFTVVQSIGDVATNTSDRPLVDVVMDSIRITSLYPQSLKVNKTGNKLVTNIYPNPSRGLFAIDLPEHVATKVEILNMTGVVVYSNEAKGTLKIDLTNKPTGLYMVRATNATGSSESRVVVQ